MFLNVSLKVRDNTDRKQAEKQNEKHRETARRRVSSRAFSSPRRSMKSKTHRGKRNKIGRRKDETKVSNPTAASATFDEDAVSRSRKIRRLIGTRDENIDGKVTRWQGQARPARQTD